jgi:uncharacterized membrane protein
MERDPLNKLAVWSLLLALLFFTFIAAILGHVSLSQIKRNGERGRGLALAGIILGWSGTVFFLVPIVAIMASPEAMGQFVSGFFEGRN